MVGFGDSGLSDGVGAIDVASRDGDGGGAGLGGGVGRYRVGEILLAILGGVFITGEPGGGTAGPVPGGVGGDCEGAAAAVRRNVGGFRAEAQGVNGCEGGPELVGADAGGYKIVPNLNIVGPGRHLAENQEIDTIGIVIGGEGIAPRIEKGAEGVGLSHGFQRQAALGAYFQVEVIEIARSPYGAQGSRILVDPCCGGLIVSMIVCNYRALLGDGMSASDVASRDGDDGGAGLG